MKKDTSGLKLKCDTRKCVKRHLCCSTKKAVSLRSNAGLFGQLEKETENRKITSKEPKEAIKFSYQLADFKHCKEVVTKRNEFIEHNKFFVIWIKPCEMNLSLSKLAFFVQFFYSQFIADYF